MRGGCFGKILTFIFGVIVGFVLFAGTIAGAGYYLVTQVTINDVENLAKTKFEFIDEEADIRDKSVLDIIGMVTGGNLKNLTVADVKTTFGIDIVSILEETLDITIREDGKAQLNDLPVLQIFQGDNLKIVLNSITLRDVLTKAGIDFTSSDSLGSKPVLQEHLDEPVVDGFNSMLKSLNISDMTIAEMEYLLGISFGGTGVLDVLADYKVSLLNDAINDITIEKIMPDFDRDMYFDTTGSRYIRSAKPDELTLRDMDDLFDALAEGATRAEGVDYYTLDTETQVLKLSDEGTLYLKESVTLPDFRERYGKDADGNFVSNRNGYYYAVVPEGTFAADRYADAEGTTQDNFGRYAYSYTANTAGSYTLGYAAVKTADGIVMEARKYMPEDAIAVEGYAEYRLEAGVYERKENTDGAAYAAAHRYNRVLNADTEKYELVEDAVAGKYALTHVGTSQTILKTLADESLSTLDAAVGEIKLGEVIEVNDESSSILKALKDTSIDGLGDKVGTLKLKEVMEITPESSKLLQELQDTEVNNLSSAIDDLTLNKIIDIKERNIVVEDNTDGEYIALPAGTYVGSYIEGYTSDDESAPLIRLVKYQDGIDAVGEYFAGQKRYTLPEDNKASSGILVSLADVTVQNMSNIEDVMMQSPLGKVIDIDGDVFVLSDYTTYADILAADLSRAYAYIPGTERDIMRAVEDGDTEIYLRVYEGASNSIIKKMAAIKVNAIADRVQVVIDETKLSEVITVKTENTLEAAADGEYIALPDGDYVGSYIVGVFEGDTYKLVKYNDNIDAAFFAGRPRFNLPTENKASNAVLVGMADKKIKNISTGMQSLIDECPLGSVIDINGDVFVRSDNYTSYADIPAADLSRAYAYADDERDIMCAVEADDTEIYLRVYEGGDSAIIKKMHAIKINNVATRIQTVIDETRLSEILGDIVTEAKFIRNDEEGYIANTNDEYGIVAKHTATTDNPRAEIAALYGGVYEIYDNTAAVPNEYWVLGKRLHGYDSNDYVDETIKLKMVEEVSNGVMVKMADMKVCEISDGMNDLIDSTLMQEVMDISGDIFKVIPAASTLEAAQTAAQAAASNGGKYVQVYYNKNGTYLRIGYVRADDGAFVYDETLENYVPYDDTNPEHQNATRYDYATTSETVFYTKVHTGGSNAVLKRLAGATVGSVASANTMTDAVKDCTLAEVDTSLVGDSNSLLWQLRDTPISELNDAIKEVCADANMRQLNSWCNLGLTEEELNKIVNGTTTAVGDMKAVDFLKLAVTVATSGLGG